MLYILDRIMFAHKS